MAKHIPAFPRPHSNSVGGIWAEAQPGMTLRDYFAGQALLALIRVDPDRSHARTSDDAYRYADAMLKEREK